LEFLFNVVCAIPGFVTFTDEQALENQRTGNPDNIFGAVHPLKIKEIFNIKTSCFHAWTSSANWTGTDQ